MDMYGDSQDEVLLREQKIELLKENAVPVTKIEDQKYMDHFRRCWSLNINMPGALENEHPHKFLPNLRPIEEFRHTPIIPISDRQKEQYKQELERYHRSAFFFEIKKESVINWAFLGVILFIGLQMVKKVVEKEEQRGINYQRMRLRRMQEN